MTKRIKTIQIRNFQSHEDLTLEIAPMLTTIVGASDAGKSAVVRAIRWALFNEPSGTQYMRVGTNDTFVRIIFDDGSALLRARNNTENYYILQNVGQEPVRLEGFGVSVPVEVTEFTGIRKVEIGEKDSLAVNIAGQLEGPFLLGEKSSVRAEAIGRLAGTDRIDRAHRAANADKFSNQRRIGQLQLDAEKMEEQLSAFAHLPELEQKIRRLTRITEDIKKHRVRLSPLIQLRERQHQFQNHFSANQALLRSFFGLEEAQRLFIRAESEQEILRTLRKWKTQGQIYTKAIAYENAQWNAHDRFLSFVTAEQPIQKGEIWLRYRYLHDKWKRWTEEHLRAKQISSRPVDEAMESYRAIREIEARLVRIHQLQTAWKDRIHRLTIGHRFIERLQHVAASEEKLERGKIQGNRLRRCEQYKERLQQVEKNLEEAQGMYNKTKSAVEKYTDAYVTMLANVKQCPYCKQGLDKDSLAHLRTHLEGEQNELRE